jgi:hypothetical protein
MPRTCTVSAVCILNASLGGFCWVRGIFLRFASSIIIFCQRYSPTAFNRQNSHNFSSIAFICSFVSVANQFLYLLAVFWRRSRIIFLVGAGAASKCIDFCFALRGRSRTPLIFPSRNRSRIKMRLCNTG